MDLFVLLLLLAAKGRDGAGPILATTEAPKTVPTRLRCRGRGHDAHRQRRAAGTRQRMVRSAVV